MVNSVSDKFSPLEMRRRAFLRISNCMYSMWEETGRSDTRLLMEPLIPNSFVIAGASRAGKEYKEHVVPRVLICNRAHEMFESGSTIPDVADFISEYLKVVLISRGEQYHLDVTLGLKNKMPEAWTFAGGGVYDRLIAAGIEFDLF